MTKAKELKSRVELQSVKNIMRRNVCVCSFSVEGIVLFNCVSDKYDHDATANASAASRMSRQGLRAAERQSAIRHGDR